MSETLNRRNFLRTAGGALAAAALGPSAGFAADAPKKRAIKKAMMFATIAFKGSIAGEVRGAQDRRLRGRRAHEPHEAVRRAQGAGVQRPQGGQRVLQHPLGQAAVAPRREGPRGGPGRPVPVAQGRQGLRGHFGAVGARRGQQGSAVRGLLEALRRGIKKAVPLAETLGVKIAIENVWNDFITKPEQAKQYLDEIDSAQVGWHFDIGNAGSYGAAETWIPVLGKKILKLHIKEFNTKAMTPENPGKGFGVQLMEGDNNWAAIMKALDAVGYEGWGITEQSGRESADAPALKDLSERFDKILAS